MSTITGTNSTTSAYGDFQNNNAADATHEVAEVQSEIGNPEAFKRDFLATFKTLFLEAAFRELGEKGGKAMDRGVQLLSNANLFTAENAAKLAATGEKIESFVLELELLCDNPLLPLSQDEFDAQVILQSLPNSSGPNVDNN